MTKQEYEFSLREITKYQKITCDYCDESRKDDDCFDIYCDDNSTGRDCYRRHCDSNEPIEGELRAKVPVEWLKSAVQANKEWEREENGKG